EDALHYDARRDLLRLRLVTDRDAVPQHVRGDRLDVLRRDVRPSVEKRLAASRPRQEDRRPRAGAKLDERSQVEAELIGPARRVDQIDHVALQTLIDIDRIQHTPQGEDVFGTHDLIDVEGRLDGRHAVEDL